MGKNRLKILLVAMIAMVLSLLNQDTLAYYQAIGKSTNVVTSGNIQFKIHEKTDQGTDFPVDGVYIVPGDIVSKRVYIENICEQPFYLRLKIVYGIDSEELPAEECFKLDVNSEHWELVDGWYYYKGIVEPNESTPNLFSHVEIVGSKVDNRYLGKTLALTVKAQAVQSKNNPVIDGQSYTALGWPVE